MAKDRAALTRAADRDMASRRVAEDAPQQEATRELVEETIVETPAQRAVGENRFDRKSFIWPVKGKIVTKFGTESIMTDYSAGWSNPRKP